MCQQTAQLQGLRSVAVVGSSTFNELPLRFFMTWHQINVGRADLMVMVITPGRHRYNAHDPPLRAHDPAFDHNTCMIQMLHSIYKIVSMTLCIESDRIIMLKS
jgi:hypothetical protein